MNVLDLDKLFDQFMSYNGPCLTETQVEDVHYYSNESRITDTVDAAVFAVKKSLSTAKAKLQSTEKSPSIVYKELDLHQLKPPTPRLNKLKSLKSCRPFKSTTNIISFFKLLSN